jgi:pyridoxine 5-phosphate synthase
MIRLGVNIDHVATVRQARRGAEPDPVTAAALATLGGADGITVHLREDRRHIQDRDLRILKETVATRLNLEMAATSEMVAIALATMPTEATLVPEKRAELTTEGGLDLRNDPDGITRVAWQLQQAGIHLAVFIDPDIEQVELARAIRADAIELQTASYSEAKSPRDIDKEIDRLTVAAAHAHSLGLAVHMGHGLNYVNVQRIVRIPHVVELNIGHSIISRAVFVGLEQAVRDMKAAMQCK